MTPSTFLSFKIRMYCEDDLSPPDTSTEPEARAAVQLLCFIHFSQTVNRAQCGLTGPCPHPRGPPARLRVSPPPL